MRTSFLLLCAASALGILSVIAQPAHQEQATASPQVSAAISTGSSTVADGQKLFETHCAVCHGPKGEGGKGPTLAQPKLPRAADDESLQRIMKQGIDGTEMPRARMESAEVAQVAA